MPQDSSLEAAGRIDDWWSTAKRDILADPFGQMARAGLFQIGLPGAGAALDGEGQDVPARTIGVRLLAREPRKGRQIRLGNSIGSEKQ
jgi:hypothetical protein